MRIELPQSNPVRVAFNSGALGNRPDQSVVSRRIAVAETNVRLPKYIGDGNQLT
jgi:hypothetical protein